MMIQFSASPKYLLLTLALYGVFIMSYAPKAQAQTMIMPLRVTFEGRERMEEITLFNPSRTSAVTYKLVLLNRQQSEDGNYIALDGLLNKDFDPETALVFSPRQITLPPDGKQKIRISLRKPADLPDGEYRTHLNLQRVGAQEKKALKLGKSAPEGVTAHMNMNFGIAIPVIVRQGSYDTTATVTAPEFIPAQGKKPAMMRFYINRTGKYSANGNIKVFWTPPGKEEIVLAARNNIKVYPEINRLQVAIPLKDGITQVTGGTVRILYEGADPDEGIKFDEKTFPIGG